MQRKDINKISVSSKELENSWHLIDAKNKVLGRLASDVARLLMGKDKVNYAPNLAGGDFVVVINASLIKVTGRKNEQKEYFSHSGYPGGEKMTSYEDMLRMKPQKVIENAVKGMLPKNKLRDVMLKRLKIFAAEDHTHNQQFTEK
ncbi:MAG: 50S ribosomal protein L13 [Chloroflexota bacterium]|nr:50S ribosomal protein L13 [Chloroflexota bacterium]